MRRACLVVASILAVSLAGAAEVYKWVDEKGVTHYSETPPPGQKSEALSSPPRGAPAAPTEDWKAKERAFERRRTDRAKEEQAAMRHKAGKAPAAAQPFLAGSEYLTTRRVWIDYEFRNGLAAGRLNLVVQAAPTLKQRIWLGPVYELPITGSRDQSLSDNIDPPMVLSLPDAFVPVDPGREALLQSPWFEHPRCRRYTVTITVYGTPSLGEVQLGEHIQVLYSRINGMRIRSTGNLSEALKSGAPCAP